MTYFENAWTKVFTRCMEFIFWQMSNAYHFIFFLHKAKAYCHHAAYTHEFTSHDDTADAVPIWACSNFEFEFQNLNSGQEEIVSYAALIRKKFVILFVFGRIP